MILDLILLLISLPHSFTARASRAPMLLPANTLHTHQYAPATKPAATKDPASVQGQGGKSSVIAKNVKAKINHPETKTSPSTISPNVGAATGRENHPRC